MTRSGGYSWHDYVDVVRAELQLLRAWWLVRTQAPGTLVAPLRPRPGTTSGMQGLVDRFGRAVDRASRRGPYRGTCLVRSIALRRMLSRAGVTATAVRVGVRWHEGRFAAHAWVEVAGLPVGADGSVSGLFDVVDDLDVVEDLYAVRA